MKRLKKRQLKTWGRQFLAFLLITALVTGSIPQSAYSTVVNATSVLLEKCYTSGGCNITYKETNTWNNYVNAEVTIQNNTDYAKSLWELTLAYEGTIDNIWNADISNYKDDVYSIAAKNYNSTIDAGKSVSFGFTAYGKDGKPKVPKKIIYGTETDDSTSTSTTEKSQSTDTTTESQATSGSSVIPEKWKGLNYALFMSGEEKLSLYTNTTNITGSVHTNNDFYYQGTSLKIDGTLEAAKGIKLNTSSEKENLQVVSKQEEADKIAMPDITKKIKAYVKENGTIHDSNQEFNSDKVVLKQPIGVKGSAAFHATSFLGEGILYATDSITYNVGDLSTPDDSRIFLMSENGNITLNGSDITLDAVLYAPNGCVTINANRFNLNGRIIAKQVCINGTIIEINAGEGDYDMLDFLFEPDVKILAEGNQKENRKVILSLESSSDLSNIESENITWNITKNGEDASDCYAIDEDNSNAYHKEILFKQAGTYTVMVQTNAASKAATKELVIVEDTVPTAAFTFDSQYYSRDKEGEASVSLKDVSSSPDGDVIGKRLWTIYYDENNDGEYAESEGKILKDGNETEVLFQAKKVGKYKVVLEVTETFEDTIPKLLDENAYRKDDTTEYEEKECVFEIGNEAPVASLDIAKSKSADIVFTVGDTDKKTLSAYNQKAETLKQQLKEQGIDANVDTVSASIYTAKDNFAWKEYDHYNYRDTYLPTMEKHILYEDKSIKMMGYSQRAIKDFLYVADDNSGKKTFEFDLQRDKNNWHSMEGGGFLFHTTVDEEANIIKGFCILVTAGGLQLVNINCNNLKGFRDGNYNVVQNAGKLLRTYSMSNLYDKHHFKIVTDDKTVSVWDGDKLLVDHFILPENDYGYGYGPITSHRGHSCRQQSYFTFENITMETMTGTSLSDIVEGYGWRPGASHYVVNLSDSEVPELTTEEAMADLAAALIQNDATFIGIGNETNENQYQSLLNATKGSGMYLSLENMEDTMTQVNESITNSILAKDDTIGETITTDDIVTYKGYYQDAENDEIYEQQWEYEYDPSIFDNDKTEQEHIVREENKPITVFENTGAYAIRLRVQDNPAGDNDALDEYRKWSGTEEYKRLLVVQSRPTAEVSVEVSENSSDKNTCIARAVYSAQDPDHISDSNKGIYSESFWYKNVKDSEWTEGKLPNKLTVGETYLVKYQVTDLEGTVSFPAVAVVKTSDLLVYEEVEDNLAPEVYIDVAKQEIEVGEELRIDAYATDDYGVENFELYVDGEKVLDSYGRVLYTGQEEGTVTIRAVATDIGGNTAEKEVIIKVEDHTDRTMPTAEITSPSPGTEIGFDVQIKGTAEDETELKQYTLAYRGQNESEYHTFEESTTPVHDDILGSLDISEFADGEYEILLIAEDVAGNCSYYGITICIETTNEKGYAITGELSDIKQNEDKTQLDVIGTASAEGHMKQYTLSCQMQGEEETIFVAKSSEEIENGILGSIPIEGLESGDYSLILTIEEEGGNSGTVCGTFTYQKGKTEIVSDLAQNPVPDDTVKKDFAIALSHSVADIGTEIKVQVTLPYNIKEETLKIAMGDTELVSGKKITSLTADKAGKMVITATGVTEEGEKQSVSASCTVYDRSDKNSPTAAIASPENDAVLTEPVDIIGSAYDGEVLDFWKLEYRIKGESKYQLLAEGTEPKKDEVFAQFDTTKLANGPYEVRLSVQDQGGNIRRLTYNYVVEGGLKIGAMNVGFTDLKEVVSGVGMSVSRTYNSTNKTSGDFGYGWTMGLAGMKLYKTNELSENWVMSMKGSGFSTKYTMAESRRHDIIIRYEDGTSDRFKAVLSPSQQAYVPLMATYMEFTCETNKKRKLEINGDNLALTSQCLGENYLFGDDEYCLFEPENFILTLETGEKVYINIDKGVTKIEDTNGNHVNVTKNGYEHSDGKGVTFTRDSQNRITKVTDTNGNKLIYTYDKDGNLSTYTDKAGATVTYTYDDNHNLLQITDPMGIAVARNEYDENGRLIAVIDANGNRTKYDYSADASQQTVTDALGGTTGYTFDSRGNILTETNALGETTRYTYDENGNQTSVTDPLGNKTTYEYDNMGNNTKVIYPDGTETTSSYNEENRIVSAGTADCTIFTLAYNDSEMITSLADAEGNETTYGYTRKGLLRSVTDAIGTYQKMTYDSDGNVKTLVNGNGTTASMTYDKDGNCLSVTVEEDTEDGVKTYTREYTYDAAGNQTGCVDPEGNVTKYTYDDAGKKTAETDSEGNVTRYTYDAAGNMVQIDYADGTKETFAYDACGNNTKATDRNGQTVTMTYNKLSQMTSLTDALGNTTSYTYDAAGNLLKESYANGAVTSYTYDSRNRNTQVKDAYGNITKYTYTENSQIAKVEDALGNVTTFAYDKNGNCIKTTYADDSSVSATYDARGRRTSQTDALGNVTNYEYDGINQLIKVTDAYGNETKYDYDQTGSVSKVTDAKGNVTQYEYDKNGRITAVINAKGQKMTSQYDSLGSLTKQVSYGGNITTYQYDDNHYLSQTIVQAKDSETKETTAYEYNHLGQVTKVTDESGSITYKYDKYSRLTKKTDAQGNYVVYQYDRYGRISSIETPHGNTKYHYDKLDRIIKVTDRENKDTEYTYDACGNRIKTVYANGVETTYTYDVCSRLQEEHVTDKAGSTIAKYSYTTDANGNRTKIKETNADGSSQTIDYVYDKLSRLTKETISKGENSITFTHKYDAVSNRTEKEVTVKGDVEQLADVDAGIYELTQGKTTYEYNSLNQLTKEVSNQGTQNQETKTYSYNEDGSLIAITNSNSQGKQAAYDYDAQQRLIRATLQQGNQAEVCSYTYDYEGNRTSKTKDDTETIYYVNDTETGYTQVLEEVNEEGTENVYYTRNGAELISMAQSSAKWYYITDGHGSVRALTNEKGAVTDTYCYDAWGSLMQKTGSTSNDYLYTGEQYNAETGLYYLRARYMNPQTGTFISMDSYAGNNSDPITLHKYLYANANPVTNTDPSGYYSVAECNAAMSIESIMSEAVSRLLRQTLGMVNSIATASANAERIYHLLQESASENAILRQWMNDCIMGTMIGMVIGLACSSMPIVRAFFAGLGMGMWANQLEEDINSGDTSLIIYDLVQAACLFGSFCAKCFTGDTLVATEDGFTRIDEIEVGDYVLAENVETGEKAYKKVTKVYVKEATELVHVKTDAKEDSDQTIDTTANHPFYVEGTGWVAAINIEAGDKLHTESGVVVTVTSVATEKLTKPIKVYNLEVEDFHTYYVTEDEVLVHNSYGENKPNQIHHFATNKSKKYTRQFMNIANKYGLDLDEEWNKELLPHQGRHAYAYHDYVLDNMQKFDKIAKGDKKKFLELYNQMKKRIINTPEMLYKNYWNKK